MRDKKETTQADLDNHANQLNKNNPEFGNSRNKQNGDATEKPAETPPNKGSGKEGKGSLKK